MIVSHRHRFIFLKTEKTAGTSLEGALAAFCGRRDIITGGRLDNNAEHARRKSRNNRLGIGHYARLPAVIRHILPSLNGYYGHIPARRVRAMVGEEVWRSYFKFAVERNPWDRQVSNYFHRRKGKGSPADFDRYLSLPSRLLHHVHVDNWGIYTIDGAIAVDAILRYESLEEEVAAICARLGIAGPIKLPAARGGYRPSDSGYRGFYSDRTRALVGQWYRKEIEAFGYEF